MRGLTRRLKALETTMPDNRGRFDLDALSDADLERLETVCEMIETFTAGGLSREQAIQLLPSKDLRYLSSIRVLPESADG